VRGCTGRRATSCVGLTRGFLALPGVLGFSLLGDSAKSSVAPKSLILSLRYRRATAEKTECATFAKENVQEKSS